MVIIGGGMGILAAYGALALISGNSPLAKTPPIAVDTPKRDLNIRPPVIRSSFIPVEPSRSTKVVDSEPPRDIPTSADSPTLPPPEQPPSVQPQQPIHQKPVEQFGANDLPKPSAIASLTLNDAAIKVIATPEDTTVGNVLCDVGFSPNLLDANPGQKQYVIVASHLTNHSSYIQELPLHINGAGAAIEIRVTHQSRSAICELRPQFSLPGVGIQPMTINRATTIRKKLSRALDDAAQAKENMSAMTARLGGLQTQVATAQANLTATGTNPADTGLIRHNATMALPGLNRSLASQKKALAAAQDVIAAEAANQVDLTDLEQIGEYAQQIASVATIYVRFYVGDTTIPATVK